MYMFSFVLNFYDKYCCVPDVGVVLVLVVVGSFTLLFSLVILIT